jgi:hypothetical protein
LDKKTRGEALIAEGKKLIEEAFSERLLPEQRKVGQRVRYLKDSEYAWSAGSYGVITRVLDENSTKLASAYQVFYTTPADMNSKALWWTTPADVELAEL